ncbi:fibronectin type III domain-containing protein [Phytophthora infestans T30-4]|uniref:Fibronectin type III domain-containing protein n=1 Tax=Phytophthora infestans (strain T30-4) TaxID=403677 RepID=D0P3C0_PHYIT|nr:fibronectin type III domain-containing protein [Phytophthora infestans T30-4]EEY59308.1 fibronectin type III domain-containing protein [Phytophthora infestans T30-4]|eukprot:XP_002895203.1 fibronectin type III domain-containing protein [Phytophthora infestans T30-4]
MQDLDVVNEFNRVDRQVYAELQRVAPGNPVSAYALVSWSAFDNALEASGGTASVEAYEVQYAVSGSGVWQSLGDSLTGFRVDLGAQATEHVPKQRIFTRADDGESINDGYFRLGLSYEGSSPSILGGRATAGVVTPPIAFDASADAMKTAIESLEQVTQVQVERNALDADGAFEWIILFDLVAYDGEDPLPLLSLYTETVSAQWTGDGDQVAVQYLRMAPSSPGRHRRICSDECSYQVTGLQTGRAFSFRVRAQYSYAIGWSSWSARSEPLEIPATPVPRAPSTPELLAATTSHVTISWRMRRELTQENGIFAREFFPVTSFQAQQQCDSEIGWTTISERIPPGFSGNSDTFVTVVASLDRPPGSTCEFRVAATNANGQGPFSLPSAKFTTLQTAPGAVANLRVARDPLTVVWNTPEVLGGHALEELTYDVEYRTTLGSTWTRLPAELVDCSSRLANISMTSLKGYTTYVTRVRAVAERQAGSFSQSAEFLADYTVEDDSNSDNVKDLTLGTRQVVIAAARQQCANTQDWYYVQLTGNGGSGGSTSGDEAKPGEHGAVLVFPVTWSGERPAEHSFFYTGSVQTYRVPIDQSAPHLAHRIVALDVYAWGRWGSCGGSGQSGKQAGGGGGGGFFGGGGGGAGVDGAGGGGGSSFVSFRDLFNSSKSGISDASLRARVSDETVDKLQVTPLTSSSVKVSWKAPRFGFSQLVEGFVIEMANRSVNEDFRLVRLVTLPATDVTEKSGTLTLHGLTPTAAYRFRVKALLLDGRGTFSDVVTLLSNDFWRYDLRTETWWSVPPPALVPSPREKHSMAVVNDRLILFGGRQNDVSDANDASTWGPRALNDLWELQGLRSLQGDKRATGTAPNARAFPVLLRSPDEAADKSECVPRTEKLQFVSTSSLEALSVFHQLPVAGNWTLELTDTAADGFVGTLDSWDVTFDVAPCVPAFTWTNLSSIATGTAPTARFQHSVVVVGSSMFIFGGTAGGTGSELSDLYRLDYTRSVALGVAPTARWTQLASLTDRESPSIAERRVHAGRATLLTPFELMAVGRGLKSPRRASLGSRTAMAASRLESQLDVRLKRLEDLIDGWRAVATASGEDESALDEQRPVPRYWAASAFVSSLPGSKVPRVFLFGGQDDTTLLDDFWSLELAQLDEDFPQDRRKSQRIRAWASIESFNLERIPTFGGEQAGTSELRMGYPVSCYQLSGMHPVTHVKVVRSSNKFKAYKKLEPSLSRRASGTGSDYLIAVEIPDDIHIHVSTLSCQTVTPTVVGHHWVDQGLSRLESPTLTT